MNAGDYQLPHQSVSTVLLGPGSSVTHDALRLLARHGCCLCAIGSGGVRMYTAPPHTPDSSALARRQVELWSARMKRLEVARRMYSLRFSEIVRTRDIEVLRGMEGARIKRAYELTAQRFGIEWKGRRYDRVNPAATDLPNQAINYAAVTVQAAASVAVASTGTIPQLGFVHEDSGQAFVLDIADLRRHDLVLDIAFGATKEAEHSHKTIDHLVRKRASAAFRKDNVIGGMIEAIKSVLDLRDEHGVGPVAGKDPIDPTTEDTSRNT